MLIGTASQRRASFAHAKGEGVWERLLEEIAALPTLEAVARFEAELPWREEVPGIWIEKVKDALEKRCEELFYGG